MLGLLLNYMAGAQPVTLYIVLSTFFAAVNAAYNEDDSNPIWKLSGVVIIFHSHNPCLDSWVECCSFLMLKEVS